MGDYAEWSIEDEQAEYQDHFPKGYRNNRHDNPNYGINCLNGVTNWLGSKWLSGIGKDTAYNTAYQRIIERYYTEILNNQTPSKSRYVIMAEEISKNHWSDFMKWVKETYK